MLRQGFRWYIWIFCGKLGVFIGKSLQLMIHTVVRQPYEDYNWYKVDFPNLKLSLSPISSCKLGTKKNSACFLDLQKSLSRLTNCKREHGSLNRESIRRKKKKGEERKYLLHILV